MGRVVGYVFALVSLDLAAVYAEQGRSADMKRLAEEMLPIFSSRDVAPAASPLAVTGIAGPGGGSRGARQLRAALTGATGAPAVLVGDLNLPAAGVSAVVSTMTGWRQAGGQPTYPAWRPRVQMHHVLVRGGVHVTGAVVHPVSTSDHLPLVVDLRVTQVDDAVEDDRAQ